MTAKSNTEVAALFKELSDAYYKLNEGQRGNTFGKAASLIKDLSVNVGAEGFNITKYPGMGPSVAKELKSFLENGTSDRLTEVRTRLNKIDGFKVSDAISFITSTGVKLNMVMATITITKLNPKSMDDLVEKAKAGAIADTALAQAIITYKG